MAITPLPDTPEVPSVPNEIVAEPSDMEGGIKILGRNSPGEMLFRVKETGYSITRSVLVI